MTTITTSRLIIKPTHKNCWSIYDQVDNNLIGKLFFRNQWFNIILKPQSLRLGVATEASFGLMKAINSDMYKARTDVPHAQKFLTNMGFKKHDNYYQVTAEALTCPDQYNEINQQLGIDVAKITNKKQPTAVQLVDSDIDCFERPTKLHPQANKVWQTMKRAAHFDGIELQLVSAFRSLNYQAKLIKHKQDQGHSLTEILATNAAPGHSEHHTGRAIDITSPDSKPLEESFADTQAFAWLAQHGHKFGLTMSYPKDNPQGMLYEPWHWKFNN